MTSDTRSKAKILITTGFEGVWKDSASLVSFLRMYKDLFGDKICGHCKNKIKSAFDNLVYWHKNTEGMVLSDKFKLKDGYSAFLQTGSTVRVSNLYLTEELAVRFLQVNPNRIKFFVKYPQNWQELLRDIPVIPTKRADPTPKGKVPTEDTEVVTGEGKKVEVRIFSNVMPTPVPVATIEKKKSKAK